MNANQVIDYVLAKTNIKLTYSRLAEILGIAKQNISRYKAVDLPERHIRAIENHFNFSLSEPLQTSLQNDDNVLSIKLKKGQVLKVEYDE